MAIAQHTTELHGDRPGSPDAMKVDRPGSPDGMKVDRPGSPDGMKVDVDPGVPLPPRPAAPPGVYDGAAS